MHLLEILEHLKERAKKLKTEIMVISLAFKDKRTPLTAKVIIGATICYALSPIDIIPDFIPVVGYLDDLILLPAMIVLAVKLIPVDLLEDCRSRVKEGAAINKKMGWIAAIIIILFWIGLISLILF